jgi:alpha-ribazole phosphatase
VKLWLVRHPRPLVATGVCYGRTDLAPDPAHTEQVALELAARLPAGLPVRTSPLARCALLAERLAQLRPDLQPLADERLRELDFGCWEGRAWDDIASAEIEAWRDDFADHAPGGGEAVRGFMARVAAAHEAHHREAVWITHAGVIRAVHLLQQGLSCPRSAADWPREALDYGAVRIVGGAMPGAIPGGMPAGGNAGTAGTGD